VTLLALAVSGRGLVDPDEPAVFADDEAFLRGRGAFETIRVYGGTPFRLDDHLARLAASAATLGLPGVEVDGLVEAALDAAGEDECVLRIYCTPGRESRPVPTAYVLVRGVPADLEDLRARGLALLSVPIGLDEPDPLAGVKSTSYALNMVAIDRAKAAGADDAVFLGTRRLVLECPTANLWWRRSGTLYTPGLELGILAGVTRAALVELAPELGYEVAETTSTLEDVLGADEVFTTSSVREVMPVASLDGTRIARGDAAAALQDALRRLATGA